MKILSFIKPLLLLMGIFLALPNLMADGQHPQQTPLQAISVQAPKEALKQPVATQKLSFKERLLTKIVEKKIRKQQRKSLKRNDDRRIHWSGPVALGMGILSALFIFALPVFGLSVFALPAAITLGIVSMIKSGPNKDFAGKGFGIAGLSLGLLSLATLLLIAIALF